MKFSPAGQGFLLEPPHVVDTSLVLMAGDALELTWRGSSISPGGVSFSLDQISTPPKSRLLLFV